MTPNQANWRDRLQNAAIRLLLGMALVLPYRRRVPFMGWIMSRIVAPLVGWTRRIDENLDLVMPNIPQAERRHLKRAVPDNAGRALIELYSGTEFTDRVKEAVFTGDGIKSFQQARAAGRPVVFVTAHFGNYDAPRAALNAQGYPVAALYRPMRNAAFNAHYVRAIAQVSEPVYPSSRSGVANLVRYLSQGNPIGIMTDLYAFDGADLDFLGKPAPTALSAARWSLKYDAELIPIYGIRRENGLDFEIRIDPPIPHSTPEEMTQAINDGLSRLVREHMDQWFWIHRRWKKSY